MLSIVKAWLKWVEKETWSHSGRCLVCKQLEFFLGIPNVNWLTEKRTPNTTKNCYGLGAPSPFRVASQHASKRRSCEGRRKRRTSTFFPRTLLPRLLSRATLACPLSISFRWRASSQAVTVFIVVREGCIVILMAQSIPSVPIPPKVFVECCHLLWLSTSEQEGKKLLKLLSIAKSVNSNHF